MNNVLLHGHSEVWADRRNEMTVGFRQACRDVLLLTPEQTEYLWPEFMSAMRDNDA